MPNIIEITDFHAPELDIYARYTEGQLLNRHEPEKGIFIAESPLVIGRALDGGCQPISILVEDRQAEHQAKEIIIKKDGRKAAYVTQRRTETDFPLIAVAAAKKDDTWYTAVGARPARASLVTEADGGSAEELAEKIADQYRYGTNLRGSAEYRKALAQIYIRRLVDEIRTKEEGGLQ